ncbi:hypothetical protein UO65_2362 [Actinokineospora spheciospongiae]|uniref:Abortive infection protein n=1 Tax=Actinokineospora spheciospongiae TaxID=909613 RepID=W7INC2_9PSEU|nr:hypothetical protein [Actinokineospora spheciospongiae]EWC62375.1 hypothetical protein UO65_2362 [Actinokineospora spheciospongiae]
MRAKGIGYDTGLSLDGDTRRPFDPDVVRRELQIIRDDLHCTAVRLWGDDLDRLEFAAEHAATLGLEVWFSPFTHQFGQEEMLVLLADGAERAERIRRRGAEVVFVTGAELSLFNRGFLPGDSVRERTAALLERRSELGTLLADLPARVNDFLGRAVAVVRERFGGKVTYASVPLERVDWTPFDVVSVDAHRSKEVAHVYQDGIRALVAQGKPVAITEFGCTPYRGAADLGALSGEIVEYSDGIPVRLDGDYTRDEEEQAGYLRELLDVFAEEGVDAAFVCTFVCHGLYHRADPREDLDMASWGVVKVLEHGRGDTYPDMPWEPKAAFAAVADHYRVG